MPGHGPVRALTRIRLSGAYQRGRRDAGLRDRHLPVSAKGQRAGTGETGHGVGGLQVERLAQLLAAAAEERLDVGEPGDADLVDRAEPQTSPRLPDSSRARVRVAGPYGE